MQSSVGGSRLPGLAASCVKPAPSKRLRCQHTTHILPRNRWQDPAPLVAVVATSWVPRDRRKPQALSRADRDHSPAGGQPTVSTNIRSLITLQPIRTWRTFSAICLCSVLRSRIRPSNVRLASVQPPPKVRMPSAQRLPCITGGVTYDTGRAVAWAIIDPDHASSIPPVHCETGPRASRQPVRRDPLL